jgi:hypothetical protein
MHITAVWGIASIDNLPVGKHYSRADDAVISVYDDAGKLIEKNSQATAQDRLAHLTNGIPVSVG